VQYYHEKEKMLIDKKEIKLIFGKRLQTLNLVLFILKGNGVLN